MMNGNEYYPIIMEPGELKALNEYAVSKLGIPLFFVTPESGRPHTDDMRGRLYEIITGLYIIYHDYGMRFLERFLKFTEEKFPAYRRRPEYAHFKSVEVLRTGFCHGMVPGGGGVSMFMKKVEFYFPGRSLQWPGGVAELTEQDCAYMVKKLSTSSNQLVQFVKNCAQAISQDAGMLTAWKNEVLSNVLNKDKRVYNRENSYFDERVVGDIVGACREKEKFEPHQVTVQQWLEGLDKQIQDGVRIEADELYNTLKTAIYNLYHPASGQTGKSSADKVDWP